MRSGGTVRVYEILYCVGDDEPGAHGGPAGDGSFVQRFRSKKAAEDFARGRTCYGQPARVQVDDVPRSLAQRWGLA